MTCRAPLEAARLAGSSDKPIVYKRGQRPKTLSEAYEALDLPCGQCVSCRLEYSRKWAIRLMHEAAWWEEFYCSFPFFLTLTYDEDHLPMYGSLVKHHVQDFFKRLRSKTGAKIRYYCVGEYGTTCPDHEVIECSVCGPLQRPHYHAIVFGWSPQDKEMQGYRDGYPVYCSNILSEVWKFGSHEFGNATFESCAYVARYIMKKQTGKKAVDHYCKYIPGVDAWVDMPPEFAIMSRGGRSPEGEQLRGIGWCWYEHYKDDLYVNDETPVPGRGVIGKPPPYYDGLFKEDDPERFADIKAARREAMLDSLMYGPSLESRAICEDARLALYSRG